MCMYCDRKDQAIPLPLPVEILGNMITPETTTVQILSYCTRRSELVVTDYNYFTKDDPSSTGIGTVCIPIKFCPMCGNRLSAPNPADNKVGGISDKLRNELQELYDRNCSLEDVINFTKRKRLSKEKSAAVLLQYYVWKAPEQCKGCENVWELPHCSCSRNHPDRYKKREKPSLPPAMIDDSPFICPI